MDDPDTFDEMEQEILLVFHHDDGASPGDETVIAEVAETLSQLGARTSDKWLKAAHFHANVKEPKEGDRGWEIKDEETYSGARHTFLEIGIRVTFQNAIPVGTAGSGYRWEIARSTTLQYLTEVVGGVLLAACIARPGSFRVSHTFADTRVETINLPKLHFHLPGDCRVLAGRFAWPPLSVLSISRVHEWMLSTDQVEAAWGTGPIGRALAALSHAASSEYRTESMLLWPLIGLEALYGRAHDGLQRQLLEKSEVLLGPRLAFKKRFASIYAERSRFVHGDMDIPFSYRLQESEKSLRFSEVTRETSALALAILVSTLQQLAEEGRRDLEFSYRRDEPPT
jgi:hypothetical protein